MRIKSKGYEKNFGYHYSHCLYRGGCICQFKNKQQSKGKGACKTGAKNREETSSLHLLLNPMKLLIKTLSVYVSEGFFLTISTPSFDKNAPLF